MRPSKPCEAIFAEIYEELRSIAHGKLRNERKNHTLQATAAVNEAFLRLQSWAGRDWSRKELRLWVMTTLDRILTDYARQRATEKRGGGRRRRSLDDVPEEWLACPPRDGAGLFGYVQELLAGAPEHAQVLQARYYIGETVAEIARAQGVSESTVRRMLDEAMDYVAARLAESGVPA